MYLRRLAIQNVRAIRDLELTFEEGCEAGWHVVLGQNGSGKSSVVRAFAVLMMGERHAGHAQIALGDWISRGSQTATMSATLVPDKLVDRRTGGGRHSKESIRLNLDVQRLEGVFLSGDVAKFTGKNNTLTVWGQGAGWFSASFGPYRRFTGGDPAQSNLALKFPRLAPHLTSLSEGVALTEALQWLSTLFIDSLEEEHKERNAGTTNRQLSAKSANRRLKAVMDFINASDFMPHGAHISHVWKDRVEVRDGNGAEVRLEEMSDGYRSALSLVLELLRQMFVLFDEDTMFSFFNGGSVTAPGVVFIDEIDVHLHPTWQRDIGVRLTRCFPRLQFVVTTHSPIVCRAMAGEDGEIHGSAWLLPRPGDPDSPVRRVTGNELARLVFGDILDAYETSLFGQNVIRSPETVKLLEELAALNLRELERALTGEELRRRKELRAIFPGQAMTLGPAGAAP